MGRDPEQLMDWLTGRHKPYSKNLYEIESFLDRKHELAHTSAMLEVHTKQVRGLR